jgi:DNA-binding SARP family transcriptional activator
LLVEVGSVVSTDRLAEILWGDDPPDDPAGAVQTHVSRLRTVLGREGGEQARRVLTTRPPGYALAVDPKQIDAGRFEWLVEEARAAPTPQRAAERLACALELWRGEPLAEFDHEFARAEATRLKELRTTARELRGEALLALGRYAQAVIELEAAVARHPLREQLRGQLMVALVRSGRQADALAVYRDLRDVLVDELGVEPSAALRRLELAILQQDEALPWPAPPRGGAPAAGGPGRPGGPGGPGGPRQRPEPVPGALPEPLTSFVGRGEELRRVARALAAGRMVVLTGVSDLIATTLGVLPAEPGDAKDALGAFLGAQQLLLVLDNCEHVVDGVAELVERIGQSCPVAFRDVVEHWRRSGDWVHMWTTLHNLVVLLDRVGADRPAAVLLWAIRTAGTGAPAFGADAHRLQTVAVSLRRSLGEEAFAVAQARGRSMSDSEVVVYALEEIGRLLGRQPTDLTGDARNRRPGR